MPFIAYDLDALKRVPAAARAAGVPEAELGFGLVRLWEHCWSEKTDHVRGAHIAGFFGGERGQVTEALEAFRFLEPDGEAYRVRGAERYLRIVSGLSEGGKKASGNLKKGKARAGDPAGVEPERSREGAGTPAGEEPEKVPGSTPSTEHRTPKLKDPQQQAPPENVAMLADDLVELETARAEHFGTHAIPYPIPDFEARWKACVAGHAGDRDWAMQTYRNFWEDPWAMRLRPPGALNAFLAPDQWPKHVRPKEGPATAQHEACHACGEPATTHDLQDRPLCFACSTRERAQLCVEKHMPMHGFSWDETVALADGRDPFEERQEARAGP